MPQEWIVSGRLAGAFSIMEVRTAHAQPLPVEGLRQLRLAPEFTNEGSATGVHTVHGVLTFPNDENETMPGDVVLDRAEEVMSSVTALTSLGAGRPVARVDGFSVKCQLARDPSRYRVLVPALYMGAELSSVTLPQDVFGVAVNPRVMRVIRWWARGLATDDAVDRLVALNNALDLIAPMSPGAPTRTRSCRSCGAEDTIAPGSREYVVNFLTRLGVEEPRAKQIYESRIDLAHARSELSAAEFSRYREDADIVADTVRRGVSGILRVQLPRMATPLPVDPHSVYMDIEYTADQPGAATGEPDT